MNATLSCLARPRRRTGAVVTSGRLMCEDLEDRRLFSVALPELAPAAAAGRAPAITQALNAAPKNLTTLIPLTITGISVQNGQLVAMGSLGGQNFTVPITLGTSPAPAGEDCPILDLHLNSIHLNLLGLKVDTSDICLAITAESGPGNLLGNLLCDVSHLLDQGVSLSTILGGLTSTQLSSLTGGLTSLLNGVLGNLTAPSAVTGVGGITAGACDILNLSLGPVDLNLLGLDVHLDNCANGPVTLDITAQPGAGNLLGNLLCTVSHLLDNGASPTAVQSLLNRISIAILGLL